MRLLNVSFCLLITALLGCGREPVLSDSSLTSQEDSDQSTSIAAGESTKPVAPQMEANSTGENSKEVNCAPAETEPTRDAVAEGAQSTPPTSSEVAARNAPEEAAEQKQPPTPTPEQIEDWSIPDFAQLELLTCHDGFGNSLLTCSAASSDGSHYVVGGERLTLFSTKESKPVADFMHDVPRELAHYVGTVAISTDGNLVASGEKEGLVRVWNLETRQQVRSWQAYESRVSQIAFSPNAKSLATSSYSNEVTVWEVKSGKRANSFETVEWELDGLEFVTDDSFVASGGDVGIWDISTGKRKRRLGSNVSGAALSYAPDQSLIIHGDGESALLLFDLQENRRGASKFRGHHGPIDHVQISHDGQLVATAAQDNTIRIWEYSSQRTVQVMESCARVVGLRWLPERLLVVVSENGRVRLWGNRKEAESLGVAISFPQPERLARVGERDPTSSALFEQELEVRSFPRLPESTSIYEDFGSIRYRVHTPIEEAMMFYRYVFDQAGWQEVTPADETELRQMFAKGSHTAMTSFNKGSAMGFLPGVPGNDVSLRYEGNYDLRWLQKHSDESELESYSSFDSATYRTADDITDVEVSLLKSMFEAGWTAYTRLNSSHSESPNRRSIDFIRGGIKLTISVGYGANGELFVQPSASITHRSLPIPADSGWIEYDWSASEPEMIANTKMSLEETVDFYDAQMQMEGWIAREHNRHIDQKDKAWLPFIRGGQDVVVRLMRLSDGKVENGGTRIIVGEPDRSSWQLAEVEPIDSKILQDGIEAEDIQLPTDATDIDYNIDEKEIEFSVAGSSPKKLLTSYLEQFAEKGWQKEYVGISDDDYSHFSIKKGKAELSFRARRTETITELSISGKGLLWSKPLSATPKRVSYGLWLIRHRHPPSLNYLDEFWKEMRALPAPEPD